MNILDILYAVIVLASVVVMAFWTIEVSDYFQQDPKKTDKVGCVPLLVAWGLSFVVIMFALIYFLSIIIKMNVTVFALPICTTAVSSLFSYKIGKCLTWSLSLFGLSVFATVASATLCVLKAYSVI